MTTGREAAEQLARLTSGGGAEQFNVDRQRELAAMLRDIDTKIFDFLARTPPPAPSLFERIKRRIGGLWRAR